MLHDEIVADYISRFRPCALQEAKSFREEKGLSLAIRRAALCLTTAGKRQSHQRRIPKAALEQAEDLLQSEAKRLKRCKDFESLHHIVSSSIGGIKRIGALTVYDIAHRLGAHLELAPEHIYLHSGTKVGAKLLGFDGERIDPALLPKPFRRLTPAEIEDCLCIYKDDLLKGRLLKRTPDAGCASPGKTDC